jgi:acylphosphatase
MTRLIYSSYAHDDFTQDDLTGLLEQSRAKNSRLDITGVLFYVDDAFIQILEGPEEAVEALYATIREDPRHYHCKIIDQRGIDTRFFSEWSMGFCTMDKARVASLEGFNDFLYKKTDHIDYAELGKGIGNLLEIYKEYCVDEL